MATKEEEVLPPVRMAEAMLQLGLHQKASVAFVSHYWASCCLGQWLDVVPIPQLLTIPALPPANPFQIGLPPTMHWTCRAVVPEVRRFQAEGERSLLPVKQTEALVQREATRSVLLQRVQDYALQGMRDQEYKALYPVWTTALERISLMRRWVARAPLGGKDHRPLTTLAIFDQQAKYIQEALQSLVSVPGPPQPLSPIHAAMLPDRMSEALGAYVTAIGTAAQWQQIGLDWTPDLLVTAVDREFCLFLEESATQQVEQYRTYFGEGQWRSGPILKAVTWSIEQWDRVIKMVRQWRKTKLVPFVETSIVELEGLSTQQVCPLARQHFLNWWDKVRSSLHGTCCQRYRDRYESQSLDRLRDWPSWTAFVLCCLECYWSSAIFTGNHRSSMCIQVVPLHAYFWPASRDQMALPLSVAFSPSVVAEAAARQVAENLVASPETWDVDEAPTSAPEVPPSLAAQTVSYGPIRARRGRIVPVLH